MEVEIAKDVGFCFGVRKAVDKLDEVLNTQKEKVYVTGDLIHNKDFLKKYDGKNVEFNEDISSYNERGLVVIRAHGISDSEREKLKNNPNLVEIIDASCPYVLRVHYLTKKMVKEGYHIVIIGESSHPETRGYYLNVKDNATVVYSKEEINNIPRVKKIAVFPQTTMNYQKFKSIVSELVTEFGEVRVFMTICPPVYNRQKSVEELSKECDLMVVLGGYNSSNTKKLRDLCARYTEAIHIENISQLDTSILKGKKKVGIAAGTSTPDWIINEAYQFLKNYNPE
ncbi:MAG: 4-hydroxy-3-methylbut-2-enyl diphosphate reductase [Brevinematales bacterium]|nr:4-hydroxy-3-methylbut-2-enyl diphosphate reductase [Brevinematales bacterium]